MTKHTKLLGTRVTEDIHALAHMTARAEGKRLSDWLRDLIENNLKSFFLTSSVQCVEDSVKSK